MFKCLATVMVFGGGFVIMVLEIVGARYLAKDFGGSFYVWVSQIGVILVALALGYGVGGRIADRYPRGSTLVPLLGIAGVVMVTIPWFTPPLIEALISRHPTERPIPPIWQRLDPAMGSALVFFYPCAALAVLCPFMIRLAARKVTEIGSLSGSIYAASTLGGIVGVFLSGYVLIDVLPIPSIMRWMGGVTILLALLGWWLDRVPASRAGS